MIIGKIISIFFNSSTKIDVKSVDFSKGIMLFLFIMFFFIFSLGQFTNVYIRHDDWEFMTYLAPDMRGYGSPWDKTLLEGRWVNYLWSFIAHQLPAKTVYCIFILGYSLLCWLGACLVSNNPRITLIIAIIFFLCPAYADLSFWPATLTPSVWITMGMLAFFINYKSVNPLFIIFSALLMLTYQPLIPVCFLLFSLRLNSLSATIKVGIYYYTGYVLGVVIIYVLNYHYHDFLGVKIADWRHPNPVHSLHDITTNFKKSIGNWHSVFTYYSWVTLSSFIGFAVIAYINKPVFIRLLTALLMILCFETLMQVYTGVDIPDRSLIWPWVLFVCILSILLNYLFYTDNLVSKTLISISAVVMLVFTFHLGFVNWLGFYNYENYFAKYEDYLGNQLRSQPNVQVFTCGDFSKIQGYQRHDFAELALAIWKKSSINLTPLSDSKCEELNLSVGLSTVDGISYYRVN